MKPRTLIGLATVLVLVLGWYVATDLSGLIDQQRFPSPSDIVAAGSQIVSRGYAGGTLLTQALYSVRLVFLGFLVAVVTGVPLGLAMGLSPRFEALVNPAFLLVRPIPPLAWIPLAIVWFGLGDSAKILVIWFAAFVPAVINSHVGVRTVDPVLIEAARRAWRFPERNPQRRASARCNADDLYRPAPVAAGFVDDAGRCRTGWRLLWARPCSDVGLSRHQSRHDRQPR